jgi:hypothetical protein
MNCNEREHTTDDPLASLIRAAGQRQVPPPEDHAQVFAASRAAWQRKVRARKQRRLAGYALAASLGVAIAAGVLFELTAPDQRVLVAESEVVRGEVAVLPESSGGWEVLSAERTALVAGTRLRAGADGGMALAVAGGGSLRIGANTEVLFRQPGVVELTSGLLYYDSQDRGDSIAIVTPLGTVRDIGTQFELRSSPSSLRLRVRNGLVELSSPLAADQRSSAGRELELLVGGALELRDVAPDADVWDWAVALAPVAEQQTVLGYLQWVARESGKVLRFDSPSTELSAQFVRWEADARGLTPLQVLEAIAATSDFSYELSGDGAILIRRRQ